MQIIRHVDALDSSLCGGALSIGNFDGVHRGHVEIIKQVVARAKQYGGPAIIFTFDPHPVQLLRPDQVPAPLTWTERKAAILQSHGVDVLFAYPTNASLLALSPVEFFEQIVLGRLGVRGLVEGDNFRFGNGRSGNVALLRELTAANGIDLDIVAPVQFDGSPVSSSRIRQLVAGGAVDTAGQLLTQPYRLRGTVTHGEGRGGLTGFPTANLEAIDTILPASGVYAGRGFSGGKTWAAAIHIGPNPTFSEAKGKVEVHLIGCNEFLYGSTLEVEFLTHLRDIETFADVDALCKQLTLDVEKAQNIIGPDK